MANSSYTHSRVLELYDRIIGSTVDQLEALEGIEDANEDSIEARYKPR